MAAKIKKGDTVVVLTGRDRGKSGEVVQVLPKEERAVVRGLNLVKRHQRQTQTAQGGIIVAWASNGRENTSPFTSRLPFFRISSTASWLTPVSMPLP